jgi:hypothetical protein
MASVLEKGERHADVRLPDVVDDMKRLAHLHQPLCAETLRESLSELGRLEPDTQRQERVCCETRCGPRRWGGQTHLKKPPLKRRREFVSGGFDAAIHGVHQLRFDQPNRGSGGNNQGGAMRQNAHKSTTESPYLTFS